MEFLYHQNPEQLHIGCEKPHAYFIPYGSRNAAKTANRAASNRFVTLCGEWDFRYYTSIHEVEDFTAPEWRAEGFDRLNVPMSWQLARGRGYDTAHYTNENYPFPVIACLLAPQPRAPTDKEGRGVLSLRYGLPSAPK